MEEEPEEVLPPTRVFIKSELVDIDFEEENVCTPADINQITSRKPKTNAKKKKRNDDIFECRQCGKVYGETWHLTRHIMSTHGERIFQCTQCDKSFTLKQYLKKHMITHTGERKHRCELCNKSFTQRGSLNLHKLIHTGQKNYLCQYCNKPFTHQAGLNIHVLIHTSKTKYPCELCKKLFKQKKSMKHHMEFYCKNRPGCVPKDKTEADVNSMKIEESSDEDISDVDNPLQVKLKNK